MELALETTPQPDTTVHAGPAIRTPAIGGNCLAATRMVQDAAARWLAAAS
ncbi:hypothetical protein AGRA3207_007505 [Actinomadura graeca]|uniref:Uncharacterized protein n=1 Tax=Actinomadura graeca TaxID=2750812 RepID=A0ABX8R4D2_9ACTN|nr:hypothetical protein [Actinomadura graeca]QXJ25936.1 hypothetical protein AGRA3207_007505 [Actinomadura graeca]